MIPPMGPVILDLEGPELSPEERNILEHPHVSGVILFTRNYIDPTQLNELCQKIRDARRKPILITVDHEGGRVQRFRERFTRIPSMGQVGQVYSANPQEGIELAEKCGWLMAAELLAVGVDLSFAPVLDLNKGVCPAIGDRAFASDPNTVIELALALVRGMQQAGMAATGKHFPGHGSVNVDSHLALPIDQRQLTEIMADDLKPFDKLIQSGIQAIMPAHIIFSQVDSMPVGFSKVWLQDILRKQHQFSGVIFSDDLNMEGAGFAGDFANRAKCALDAGCDMVLICNNRQGAIQIVDQLPQRYSVAKEKFAMLQGNRENVQALQQLSLWQENRDYVRRRFENEYTR